jgi:MFS superfamily sulfate permease-like transporter
MVLHVRRHYLPQDTVVTWDTHGQPHLEPSTPGVMSEPGLVVYRFGVGLFYANAQRLSDEAFALVDVSDAPRWFVLDAAAIDDVDYTGGETLAELAEQLTARKIVFGVVDATDHLRRELERFGVEAREFDSLEAVRDAFHAAPATS